MFNSVTTWGLLLKLYNILPERKELSINTKQNVYLKFLKRKWNSFRTQTYLGQPVKKQWFINAALSLNNVWDKRIENRFWDSIIGNIDETPVWFNMAPNKT